MTASKIYSLRFPENFTKDQQSSESLMINLTNCVVTLRPVMVMKFRWIHDPCWTVDSQAANCVW